MAGNGTERMTRRAEMPPDEKIADSLEEIVDRTAELIQVMRGIDDRLRDIEGTIALFQANS